MTRHLHKIAQYIRRESCKSTAKSASAVTITNTQLEESRIKKPTNKQEGTQEMILHSGIIIVNIWCLLIRWYWS